MVCLRLHIVRQMNLLSWQYCEPWINKVSAAVVFEQNQLSFQQAVSSSSFAAFLAVSTTATVAAQLSLWETLCCTMSCMYMYTIGANDQLQSSLFIRRANRVNSSLMCTNHLFFIWKNQLRTADVSMTLPSLFIHEMNFCQWWGCLWRTGY